MKSRKVLVAAGVVLLALVVVGLLFGRSEARGSVAPSAAVAAGSATNGETRVFAPAPAVAAAAAAATSQTPTARGTLPYVLTGVTAFDKPLRLAVEALGAKTVSSVSRKAILIEATPETIARLKADARFEDVVEFVPAEKIQPELAALVEKGATSVEVSILSLEAADRESVITMLEAAGGEMLKGCINEGDTIRAKIPSDCVAMLAARGEIRWLETFERPKFMNDHAVDAPLMNVRTGWSAHGLTGRGQKISTSDSGIDTGNLETLHRDLRGNVKDIQIVEGCYTSDVNGHGTHTAGSIVGDGTESTNNPSAYADGPIRGTAYEANLYAWFCEGKDDEVYTPTTMMALYLNGGAWSASIHSASWGRNIAGQYTSQCVDHDRFVWEHPEFLPVFAAGNNGYNYGVVAGSIGAPGSAKNVLAVGATQSSRIGHDLGWGNGDPKETAPFSSRGPCQDGRIKPDIAAPGVGILSTRSHGVDYGYGVKDEFYAYNSGTSMACPLTAGAVALVRQWLVEQKGFDGVTETSPGVTNRLPTAALMKAVVMGGAKDASVPNNDQGWGRVDLEETLFPSGGRAVKLVDRIPFAPGFVTNIVVETTNAAPLDVQLVWVDYPGSPSGSQSEPRLVNDLDLTVEPYGDGEGTLYYGNGGDEPDTLNNVESVRIAAATPGKYVITIDCRTILHDHTEGGAAALYIRGAFDPAAEPEAPKCVHLEKLDEDFFGLDRALAAVREDDETVKIIRPTRLWKSVTIPTNCTVMAEAAEPDVAPVVRCMRGAVLTVPANVSIDVKGVAFTNVCAGFAVAGRLAVSDNAAFEDLSSLAVAEGGLVAVTNVSIAGDAPVLSVASNGVVRLNGLSVAGAASPWTVRGLLYLEQSNLAANQAVTVEATGNLTLGGGIANLAEITFERASADCLTLTGELTEGISVYAPGAYAIGTVFGTYACDPVAAEASASRFRDVLDPEGDLGGKAEADGTLVWAIVEAPPEAAGAFVDMDGVRKYFYTFKSAFRSVTNDAALTVLRDETCTNALPVSHALTLTSTNGAALTLAGPAGFVLREGARMTVTNALVRGAAGAPLADCAFKVTGGDLTLESGATLSSLANAYQFQGKPWGGAVVVTAGSVTMNAGSRIENCVAHAGASGGGAIYLGGADATANLFGGTITGCSAPAGGAVYAYRGSAVNVSGDFTATDNTAGSGRFAKVGNLSLVREVVFALVGPATGRVGVSFRVKYGTSDLNAEDALFLAVAPAVSEAAAAASAPCFVSDVDDELFGRFDDVEGAIAWMRVRADGQIRPWAANVIVEVDGESVPRYYATIDDAFAYVKADARFGLRSWDVLTRDAVIEHAITIGPWNDFSSAAILRQSNAVYRVVAGGSLTISHAAVWGASAYSHGGWYFDSFVGLISVCGGSLTLDEGAEVGYVWGAASRAANAITVYDGGTLTMNPGAYVAGSCNEYVDAADAAGCGGAILLDRSTAYLRGGEISYSAAYRGGAVCVANGSTLYVGGSCVVTNNTDLTYEDLNNITVSRNSRLIVDDEFTGSIGFNEGVAGDTNWFGTVTWDWPSVEALANCAARFVHDKTCARGVAVTNGVDKTAVLVWSDWLTHAGSYVSPSGTVYRVCLAPGQTFAVPRDFSVAPTTTADGRRILALDGGVEGCWYTVYSTDDLAKPFAAERSVQLKKGETFEYEIDPSAASKFYKVVAEEGIR